MKSLRHFARVALHAQLMPILEAGEETTLVGGQAVMEGVMMRAPHSYCVAVRKANGEMVTEEAPLEKLSEKYPIFKLPVLRGLGTLGQAMQLGMKALQFSANQALDETPSDGSEKKKPTEIPGWMMAANLIFMLGFFIFMYKVLPLFLARQLGNWNPAFHGRITENLVDGVIRIVLFLSFLYAISLTKDIQRVFQYHGAEHKVVFNFESGQPVTIDNAQRFVTFHPRCGTSFMLVVMVISLVVYAFLPVDNFFIKLALRIAMLPLIAGLSYELIRFAAKRQDSLLMKAMTAPGLWLQRITTKQPDNTQAAVAIHALEGAMNLEKSQGGELVIA